MSDFQLSPFRLLIKCQTTVLFLRHLVSNFIVFFSEFDFSEWLQSDYFRKCLFIETFQEFTWEADLWEIEKEFSSFSNWYFREWLFREKFYREWHFSDWLFREPEILVVITFQVSILGLPVHIVPTCDYRINSSCDFLFQ